MGWLNFFRSSDKASASTAKERLQVVVAHQRSDPYRRLDYLPRLQKELLEVIRRYVKVEDKAVKIDVESDGEYEVLELNIILPESGKADSVS